MLVLPTSGTTALIIDTPFLSSLPYALITAALGFGGIFLVWEMLLSHLLGLNKPSKPHWLWLAGVASGAACSTLLPLALTRDVTFNPGGEWVTTTWGYAIAPVFALVSLACIVVLLVQRFVAAGVSGSLGSVPAVVLWSAGCLIFMAFGVLVGWQNWWGPSTAGLAVDSDIAIAAGLLLTVVMIGTLASVAVLGIRPRETARATAETSYE